MYLNFRTADEWKNFYFVSSAVVLYDLLEDEIDQQILACFVRACSIFVSKILTPYLLEEAHQLVIKLLRLIEEAYGKAKISDFIYSKCDGNQRYITKKIIESQTIYFPFWCCKSCQQIQIHDIKTKKQFSWKNIVSDTLEVIQYNKFVHFYPFVYVV